MNGAAEYELLIEQTVQRSDGIGISTVMGPVP